MCVCRHGDECRLRYCLYTPSEFEARITGLEQGVVEELTRSDNARMENCACAEQAHNTDWIFVGIHEKGIKAC